MELKTIVHSEPDKQEIRITRVFDLPLALLFKAYVEPSIVEQWMGTKVLKLENQKHGGWQFQTRDPKGNIVFQANGVIHGFIPNQKIIRTFEMENAPFGVQLEFLDFEALDEDRSKLSIHILYESTTVRDQMLKIGMGPGLNMAHNRLQDMVGKLK